MISRIPANPPTAGSGSLTAASMISSTPLPPTWWVSFKAVQEPLGHAAIQMTRRQAHLAQGHLEKAGARLSYLPTGKETVNFGVEVGQAENLLKG